MKLKGINKIFCFFAVAMMFTSLSNAQTKEISLPKPGLAFKSSIKLENLDPAVYSDWVDGTEKRIQTKDERPLRQASICAKMERLG